jgi:CheY-like chemotaxis protein
VPVTILVAEDSVTMRRVVEMTFAGEKDARVVCVDSGSAALQKAGEIRPDVVLADGSMPGMDGYELARSIKSDGALSNTAVIVMASQKNPYDDGRGKSCGVDDHIIKPFDTQHMLDRVQQVLGKPRAQAQGGAPMKPATVQMSSSMTATVPNVPAPVIGSPMPKPAQPSPVGLNSPVAAKPAAAPAVSRAPAAPAAQVAKAAAPAAAPARPAQAVPAKTSPAAAATAPNGDLAAKLAGLGLNADQVAGVLSLSREVIEQVVWEVVPDLAETIIREEIARLTAE